MLFAAIESAHLLHAAPPFYSKGARRSTLGVVDPVISGLGPSSLFLRTRTRDGAAGLSYLGASTILSFRADFLDFFLLKSAGCASPLSQVLYSLGAESLVA